MFVCEKTLLWKRKTREIQILFNVYVIALWNGDWISFFFLEQWHCDSVCVYLSRKQMKRPFPREQGDSLTMRDPFFYFSHSPLPFLPFSINKLIKRTTLQSLFFTTTEHAKIRPRIIITIVIHKSLFIPVSFHTEPRSLVIIAITHFPRLLIRLNQH